MTNWIENLICVLGGWPLSFLLSGRRQQIIKWRRVIKVFLAISTLFQCLFLRVAISFHDYILYPPLFQLFLSSHDTIFSLCGLHLRDCNGFLPLLVSECHISPSLSSESDPAPVSHLSINHSSSEPFRENSCYCFALFCCDTNIPHLLSIFLLLIFSC